MDDHSIERNRRYHKLLLIGATSVTSPRATLGEHSSGLSRSLWSVLANVAPHIGTDGAWSHAATREALRTLGVRPHDPGGHDDPRGRFDMLSVKAAALAHAVVEQVHDHMPPHELVACNGRLDDVGSEDERDLGRILESTPRSAPMPPFDGTLTFRFPVLVRRPKARTARAVAPATATVGLVLVDPVDAPVVARLSAPDGGWFDVRDVDGTLYRPVLGPGTWTPASLDTFRGACLDGVAWRDSPFLVRPHQDAPAFALDDHADPDLAVLASSDPGTAAEAIACMARAGKLLLIDGIVHRPAPEPTLHLVGMARDPERLREGDLAFRVAWRMGDLWSTDDQDTSGLGIFGPRPARNLWVRSDEQGTRDRPPSWATVPLGDHVALTRFLRTRLDGVHASVGGLPVRCVVDALPPVGEVDPARFPASSDPLLDRVAAFREDVFRGSGKWDRDADGHPVVDDDLGHIGRGVPPPDLDLVYHLALCHAAVDAAEAMTVEADVLDDDVAGFTP